MSIQTIRPDLGEVLPDPASLPDTIAVVLGGPMGVKDRSKPHMEWLQRELKWLSIWHQRKKPVLGICLGAQLLAVAAGGSVGPLEVGDPPQALKELGIGAIHWLRELRRGRAVGQVLLLRSCGARRGQRGHGTVRRASR